jgi:hypothetical protein
MRIVSLTERRKKLRRELESQLSPSERLMETRLELLLDTIDDLRGRVDELEARQLQLVRALNELLTRLEADE